MKFHFKSEVLHQQIFRPYIGQSVNPNFYYSNALQFIYSIFSS